MGSVTRSFVVSLLALALMACGPTPSPAPLPSSPSAATPGTAATLIVEGTVESSCGSIGGCAYWAQVRWPHGIQAPMEFVSGRAGRLVIPGGTWEPMAAGQYEVVMTSYWMSDVFLNGKQAVGGLDARCSSDLTVADGQTEVRIDVVFNARSCEIEIRGG